LTAPLLCRSQARFQPNWRPETGILHSQWFENIPAGEFIQHQSAGPVYHFAEGDIIQITVNEARARFVTQRLLDQAPDRFIVPGPTLPEIEVRRIAGAVREQQFNRDPVPTLAFDFRNVVR
jgi:hypothetical protein